MADERDGPEGLAPTAEEIALESARALRLQRSVDMCIALIYQTADLTLGEAIDLAREARDIARKLFPGREETFNLLYRPRLMRAIRERFGIDEVDVPDA